MLNPASLDRLNRQRQAHEAAEAARAVHEQAQQALRFLALRDAGRRLASERLSWAEILEFVAERERMRGPAGHPRASWLLVVRDQCPGTWVQTWDEWAALLDGVCDVHAAVLGGA